MYYHPYRVQDIIWRNSCTQIDNIEFRIQLNQFEMFVSSLIHERTPKTVLLYRKTLLRENNVNRESKSLYFTI